MRALAQDEERVAFWRRHTLSGIVLCEVLPAIIAARTLTTDPPRSGLLLALTAAVAGSAPLLALVPVDRLVRHPRGRLFFDVWEALGIALVITFCVLDEGADSPYVLFLFVLLAHAALAYPPAGVALAGTSILVGYLGMGLGLEGVPADDVLVGALALAVATATCAFASANHQRAYQRTAAYAQQVALLAERDGLTGALNHRTFHQRLRTEAARATADRPLSAWSSWTSTSSRASTTPWATWPETRCSDWSARRCPARPGARTSSGAWAVTSSPSSCRAPTCRRRPGSPNGS